MANAMRRCGCHRGRNAATSQHRQTQVEPMPPRRRPAAGRDPEELTRKDVNIFTFRPFPSCLHSQLKHVLVYIFPFHPVERGSDMVPRTRWHCLSARSRALCAAASPAVFLPPPRGHPWPPSKPDATATAARPTGSRPGPSRMGKLRLGDWEEESRTKHEASWLPSAFAREPVVLARALRRDRTGRGTRALSRGLRWQGLLRAAGLGTPSGAGHAAPVQSSSRGRCQVPPSGHPGEAGGPPPRCRAGALDTGGAEAFQVHPACP